MGNIRVETENNQFIFKPSLLAWQNELEQIFPFIEKQFENIACLRDRELGTTRENKLIKVFDEEDAELDAGRQMLASALGQALFICTLFAQKIKQFEFLVGFTNDKITKKLSKDNSFEHFERLIQRMKNCSEEIARTLFADQLTVGLFVVDVKDLRELLRDRIEKGSKTIYKLLISKINKEN